MVGIAGALALVLLLGAVLVVRWVTFSPDPSGKDVALSETSTVQTFALAGKTVSLSVPDSAGTPQARTLPYSATCVRDRVIWQAIPQGSRDARPLLVVATTGVAAGGGPAPGCPKEGAVNGRFPGWGSTAEAPADARAVAAAAPIQKAVRFPVAYTQCTNECYHRTYTVTVVDFVDPAAGSLWIQSWGIPDERLDAMLASLRVS